MGDYNVCCSISGISIDRSTKVAYIPLELSNYHDKVGSGNNILIYKHCFYSPVTLPVFGSYDSYGGINRIEKNYNTEAIEKYFKAKIEDIVSLAKTKKPISSGMFIYREIFDFLLTNIVDEWGNSKKRIENNFGDRLNNLFKKHCQGLADSVKSRKEHIEVWRSFTQNEETKNSIKYYKKLKYWDWVCTKSSIFQFREYKRFNNIYQPQMLKGKMEKEITDFVLFEMGMYAVNRFYFPAMNGQQYGNKYASRNLYRKCTKIMIRDIKELENAEWD